MSSRRALFESARVAMFDVVLGQEKGMKPGSMGCKWISFVNLRWLVVKIEGKNLVK